jgi:hypothetical protein
MIGGVTLRLQVAGPGWVSRAAASSEVVYELFAGERRGVMT